MVSGSQLWMQMRSWLERTPSLQARAPRVLWFSGCCACLLPLSTFKLWGSKWAGGGGLAEGVAREESTRKEGNQEGSCRRGTPHVYVHQGQNWRKQVFTSLGGSQRAWHNPAVMFHSSAQEGNRGLLPHQLPWLCWMPLHPRTHGREQDRDAQ